jgi:molybdopterin-guanine dinucleotide biosynthesis protein A
MGGQAKSFLTVGGERIIDRQLRVLRDEFAEILIVANEIEAYVGLGVPVWNDVVLGGKGPLAGILTALERANACAVVCVACDMPFLERRALALLRDAVPGAVAVVASAGGQDEPLLARYGRAFAPFARNELFGGSGSVLRALAAAGAARVEESELRAIDPKLGFLRNVNTPEELARANGGGG